MAATRRPGGLPATRCPSLLTTRRLPRPRLRRSPPYRPRGPSSSGRLRVVLAVTFEGDEAFGISDLGAVDQILGAGGEDGDQQCIQHGSLFGSGSGWA